MTLTLNISKYALKFLKSLVSTIPPLGCGPGGTRTHTPFLGPHFECGAYTIPPQGQFSPHFNLITRCRGPPTIFPNSLHKLLAVHHYIKVIWTKTFVLHTGIEPAYSRFRDDRLTSRPIEQKNGSHFVTRDCQIGTSREG